MSPYPKDRWVRTLDLEQIPYHGTLLLEFVTMSRVRQWRIRWCAWEAGSIRRAFTFEWPELLCGVSLLEKQDHQGH